MEYLYKGKTIKIEQDDSPDSPREWDNLGKMACMHKRYTLGDKDEVHDEDFYDGWEGFKDHLIKQHDAIVILPLGLYDHSGITMYIGSSHDRWDGGQVGFIYASREAIQKEYGVKRISKAILAEVERVLRNEVKVYDQYLTGDVYGYDTGEDSCWGFYGEDEAKREAESAVDCQIVREQQEREKKLKEKIFHRVPLIYR